MSIMSIMSIRSPKHRQTEMCNPTDAIASKKFTMISYRGSLVNSHLALQTIAQRRRKSVLSEEKEIVLIENESGSFDFIIDIQNNNIR